MHRYGNNEQILALRSILLRANELQLIDLSELVNKSLLRPRTKEELLVVLGQNHPKPQLRPKTT